jgi:hypothetical protein
MKIHFATTLSVTLTSRVFLVALYFISVLQMYASIAEAQFIVPDWGDKVDYGLLYRPGPSGFRGWRAGTTILSHSRLYSPVSDYEFDCGSISTLWGGGVEDI